MNRPDRVPDLDALLDGATYRNGLPLDLWAWMRAHRPLARHERGDFPAFRSVSRYDDVRAVLRDPATFSSAAGILLRPVTAGADPGGGRTMALSDPPRHTTIRDAIAGHFAPRHLRTLAASLDAASHAAVARAVEAGQIDFVADVAAPVPVEVICTLFDLPESDRPSLIRWTDEAFCAPDARTRSVAHMAILDYFGTLVRARRSGPGDDLVSVLATLTVDGSPLSVQDVVLTCDNLLVGGTENARLAIAGGVAALVEDPRRWALLVGEFDRVVDTAIEEMLRWTSSATHLMRRATRDAVLGGETIEAGETVVCWPPSANRDGRRFTDPDVFDLRRSPNRHLALGAGPHYCVGVMVARMQMRAILRELVTQVGELVPAGEPRRLESIVVNGLRELPLVLTPRR